MSLETNTSVPTSQLISALQAEAEPVRSNPNAKINLLDAVFEMAALTSAIASALFADHLLTELEQPEALSPKPNSSDLTDVQPCGDDPQGGDHADL